MTHPVIQGLAAVWSEKEKKAIGAAVAISSELWITCRHVVNSALNLTNESPLPKERRLSLRLASNNQLFEAQIDSRSPWEPQQPGALPLDLTLLKVTRGTVPTEAALPFVSTDGLYGRNLEAFGYPIGLIERAEAKAYPGGSGFVQLDPPSNLQGPRIRPGYSGGPIWDNESGGVVGISIEGTRTGGVRISYMLRSERIAEALPGVVEIRRFVADAPLSADAIKLQHAMSHTTNQIVGDEGGSLDSAHYFMICPDSKENLDEVSKISAFLKSQGATGHILDPKALPEGTDFLEFYPAVLRMSHVLLFCISVAGPNEGNLDLYKLLAKGIVVSLMKGTLLPRLLPILLLDEAEATHNVAEFYLQSLQPLNWRGEKEACLPKLASSIKYWMNQG